MIALLPGVATVELPSESFDFLLGGSELSATYLKKIMLTIQYLVVAAINNGIVVSFKSCTYLLP